MLDKKKIKGCTSLVLSTLCVGTSVISQQTASAAWYDFLWYLMPTFCWNYLFKNGEKQEKKVEVNQNRKERLNDARNVFSFSDDTKVKDMKKKTRKDIVSDEIEKKQIKEKNKNKALKLLEEFSQNQGQAFLSSYDEQKNGTRIYEFSMDIPLEGEDEPNNKKPNKKKMFKVVLDDSRFTVHKFDWSGNKSEVLYYLNLCEEDVTRFLDMKLFQRFLLICDRIFSHCRQNKIKASIPNLRGTTIEDYDDDYSAGDFCIDFDFVAPNDIVDYLGEPIYKIRIGTNGVIKLWTEELRNGSPKYEFYKIFPNGSSNLQKLEESFVTGKIRDIKDKSSFAWSFEWNVLPKLPEDEEIKKCIKGLIQKKFSGDNGCFANTIFIDEVYKALSPDLQKIKETMSKNINSGLKNAIESVYGSEIENLVKKKAALIDDNSDNGEFLFVS